MFKRMTNGDPPLLNVDNHGSTDGQRRHCTSSSPSAVSKHARRRALSEVSANAGERARLVAAILQQLRIAIAVTLVHRLGFLDVCSVFWISWIYHISYIYNRHVMVEMIITFAMIDICPISDQLSCERLTISISAMMIHMLLTVTGTLSSIIRVAAIDHLNMICMMMTMMYT